jgi:hypothetical protein
VLSADLPAAVAGVSRTTRPALPGTVGRTDTGSACVGLLEDGRGLAGTPRGVFGPGRRRSSGGETVETWVVGGREATNRAGAAEYLGLVPHTVFQYSSPTGRPQVGWPEPLPERVDGQEVFALADLDTFAASRRTETPPAPAVAAADLDRPIGVAEFAELKGVPRDTFKRYVEDSLDAWARGEDGYLPQPDFPPQPAPVRGLIYQWRLGNAVAWSFPTTRRTGGRRPGPRPQVADLQAVLAAAGTGERPTVRELAAALSERMGSEVSAQTVRRLLRRERDAAATN